MRPSPPRHSRRAKLVGFYEGVFYESKNETAVGGASFSRLVKLTCGVHVPRAELCTAAADCVRLLWLLRLKHVGFWTKSPIG